MSYDAIPQELKQARQWVTWRYEKEGKPVSKDTEGATKIPYNARTGHKASSTNENTWAAYSVAVSAAASRQHDGIGYVFSENDPYTGIDLDDCIDPAGEMQAWARDIVATMDSYTEISPSGSGVKIWVEGEIPASVKTPKIEMYFKARYFTVTGQHLANTPMTIRNVNGALTQLYESVKREDAAPASTPRATIGNEHAAEWARKKLADAIRMVALATDGVKHDTLFDAARLAAGALPHITESEIETALYAAIEGRAADKHGARKTIRDGIRTGAQSPLPVPPPPPQPVFDAENYACCPTHQTRLDPAKNGNGYKCRQRDATTASGWCDFWWKGEGYIAPRETAAEPVVIAGEIITQSPIAPALTAPRYVLYKLSGLRALPPATWLVQGEIPAGLTTIICGPSGAGKSFLMIDYVMRVARANPDRIVVYIAPEGGTGYHLRTQAWLNYFGGEEPDNLLFILQAIPLLDPKAVHDLIGIIRPFNPVMLVIDTLARCLVGGDENSAKDVGMFFYHTDQIRQETGAAISIVHHTGKAGGFRGSSALYGSVESWIDVANDDGLITISCGKSKDSQPFPPRYLRMVPSGESVVLLPADQVDQRNAPMSEGQRKILETLALEIFRESGAKRAEIASASGLNELTIFKILSRMKRDRLINQSKKGDPYFISDEGLSAIRAYHRELRQKRDANRITEDSVIAVPTRRPIHDKRPVNPDDITYMQSLHNAQPSSTSAAGIYMILNTATKKRYIGLSHTGIGKRWETHLSGLRRGKAITREMQQDWDRHGESSFVFSVVEETTDEATSIERETYWIAVAEHCGHVYNLRGSRNDTQLANSQSTSNQLATSSPNQLATSNNLLSIRESKFATSSGASSDSSGWRDVDLFPEDIEETETIHEQPTVGPAAAATRLAGVPDWDYLNKMFAAGNMAGFKTHCALSGLDTETTLRQIEAERGIQEQTDDDD